MDLSYHHANPYAGNESFLLRFQPQGNQNPTACILVDAGPNVDVTELLGDDEYLTAVVLTHAHSDHYLTLAANLRDGAPIYTSKATARILDTVLSEAERHTDDIGDIESILNALEPLEEWESPVKGLRLAPIPAGHTPGAAGFVFQFDDGAERETILATGDWTPQRAAGYHGFDSALPFDIGAVFLTAATNEFYEETLSESVGTVCERAFAGSSVLVSASGLTSLRYAYLVGHLGERLDRSLPVTLVGQAAKLYKDLDYDVPNVKTVAEFDDPSALLERGTVTIAGPEVPTEGSSGQLFGVMRNDPSATLVQLVAGEKSPVSSAACTTYDFELIAHPTEAEVDRIVEDFDPMQVVVTHQRGQGSSRFKDKYNSFVWATDTKDEYTIYEDSEWVAPPWMTSEGVAYVHRDNDSRRGTWLSDAVDRDNEKIPLPACERIRGDADLEAEGLNMRTLEQRLELSSTVERGSQAETAPSKQTDEATADDPEERQDGVADDHHLPAEALASIIDRLDTIESQLDGTTVPARVVDAGEGVTLLRLHGDIAFDQGQTVEVTIRDSNRDDQK